MNSKDLAHLIYCALNNKKPDISFDADELFKIAKRHNIVNILYYVFDNPSNKWEEYWAIHLEKNIFVDEERKKIITFMKKNNIWQIPLKGVVLQKLYPVYGMREMSDNDILFDESKEHLLDSYMVDRGYKAERGGLHNMYTKKPCYNFEMHKRLFNKFPYDKFYEFFKDKKYFSDEDQYLYLVCHRYKHTVTSGSGFKFLIDIYVYLKNKKLDMTYIQDSCKKLGIYDYEIFGRKLANKAFGNSHPKFTEEEKNELTSLFSSSDYGSTDVYVRNKFLKYGKNPKMFFSYFFPSKQNLKDRGFRYPKYSVTLPIYWIRLYVSYFKTYNLKNYVKSFIRFVKK